MVQSVCFPLNDVKRVVYRPIISPGRGVAPRVELAGCGRLQVPDLTLKTSRLAQVMECQLLLGQLAGN
jgi:hypothetical protein